MQINEKVNTTCITVCTRVQLKKWTTIADIGNIYICVMKKKWCYEMRWSGLRKKYTEDDIKYWTNKPVSCYENACTIWGKRQKGGLLSINRFTPATLLCLSSQSRTWIFTFICLGLLLCSVNRSERWFFCSVDIGGMVDNHY